MEELARELHAAKGNALLQYALVCTRVYHDLRHEINVDVVRISIYPYLASLTVYRSTRVHGRSVVSMAEDGANDT